VRIRSRLIVVVLLLSLGTAWAGADDSPVETARKSYALGVTLFEQGDYHGALKAFNDAYAASPHFAVLYNIGQAQIARDKPLEAAATLSRYLREGQALVPAERRRQVEAQIELIEALLGELEVLTEPTGALLSVDGRNIGRTPLAEPIRLAAGVHRIAAGLDGYGPVARSVVIGQGKRHEVLLLLPMEVAKVPEVAARPAPVLPPSRVRPALPYVLAGVGVALAGGALGAYLWERDAHQKWLAALPPPDQPKGTPEYAAAATQSNHLASSVATAKATMLGLAIASGVLVTTGATLYFFDRPSTGRSALPTIAWGQGAFTVSWRCSW
jgi:tetratricopeptide (TPR) repeat protein